MRTQHEALRKRWPMKGPIQSATIEISICDLKRPPSRCHRRILRICLGPKRMGIGLTGLVCLAVWLFSSGGMALRYSTQSYWDTKLNSKLPEVKDNRSTSALPGERKVEHDMKQEISLREDVTEKRQEIVKEFIHSWDGYKKWAWGHDELAPIAKKGRDSYNMGLTIVDSLDTLIMMEKEDDSGYLKEEYGRARDWIANNLQFETQKGINLFETTIRVLGGLLSAYFIKGDELFKQKAKQLGDKLLVGFQGSGSDITGIPYGTLDLKEGRANNPAWSRGASSSSEVMTLQLEFAALSRITGDNKYRQRADNASNIMANLVLKSEPKLIRKFVHQFRQAWSDDQITFGARVDSGYEYLLKDWLFNGRGEKKQLQFDTYLAAMDDMHKYLWKHTNFGKYGRLGYIAERLSGKISKKMDHLVCFAGGMLAMGSLEEDNTESERDLKTAEELTETCYLMYKDMATGLAPEIIKFGDTGFYVTSGDTHNLLRPETVESLMYLWRITKDEKYRQWGWEIFQSFKKYARIPTGGYSTMNNVKQIPVSYKDHMESFWMAETLKYLYLLFSDDDVYPLDKWVFNTEAHPFPIDWKADS